MKLRRVPLSSLIEDPDNERRHPDGNVAAIRASIERFGQAEPLIVRAGTSTLIAGHGRLLAMRELGVDEVDVVDFVGSDDEVRALRIALNRTAETARWDDEALATSLRALLAHDFDIGASWFTMSDLRAVEQRLKWKRDVDDPGAGALPDTPTSIRGETYVLGPHRLVCGDCRDDAVWSHLLEHERIGCVWTDPPYGINYRGGTLPRAPIDGDDDVGTLLEVAFASLASRCRPGAAWYVCAPMMRDLSVFIDSVAVHMKPPFPVVLIWAKSSATFSMRSDYQNRHESILYGWLPGAHTWVGGSKQTTVLEVDRPKRSPEHPTMKPVELIERCLRNSTTVDDIVCDPFAGSGSTLIAAARLGLSARCIEIEPAYCDVIRRRWTAWALDAEQDAGPGALR